MSRTRDNAEGALHTIFRGVVLHPVAMTMVFLAALVFGVVSYQRLPVELMPDISYPTITVRTAFEGAAPQEVETQVSRPIESQLATLDGLVEVESRSRAGQADVVLGFDWGTDMSASAQSVREKLQAVFLPKGTDAPLILRYDPSLEPFLRVALSLEPGAEAEGTEASLFELRRIAEDEIQRELEGMPGVAAVRLRGGLTREIQVAVREDLLAARRLSVDQVASALSTGNVNMAGGSILEGDKEYLVRTLNEVRSVEEIQALQIRRADGVKVPLIDVARVYETHADRKVVSHLNGSEAVEVEIFKEADANVVDVARRVKDRLMSEGTPDVPTTQPMYVEPGLAYTLPDGVVLELLDDQASFIESSISNLLSTALLGAVFAVAILFLFLRNFRATAIIGLAIPISVVIGFAPLYLFDVTLNLMSLGGLALGIGMLVDNAVVVLESIQRYLDEGDGPVEAAVRGTADVAAAVTASTLTTVAVFFPIVFVEGVAGEMFGDLSVAVVSSLLASLAVALFLVPTLAALRLPMLETGVVFGAASVTGLVGFAAGAASGDLSVAAQVGVFLALAVGLALATALSGSETSDMAGGSGLLDPGRRGIRDWWHGLGRSIFWDARERMGRFFAGVGLRRMAARCLVDPEGFTPRWWTWLTLPFALGGAALLVVWGLMKTGVTGLALFSLGVIRVVSWVLERAVGRPLLWIAGGFQHVYRAFEGRYGRLLPWVLRRPGLVLGLAVLTLVVSVFAGTSLGTELIPEVHQGRFVIDTALPVGTPLSVNIDAIAPVERLVAAHPDVRSVYATVGSDGGTDAASDEGEHTAKLRVQLEPRDGFFAEDVQALEARVMEELRQQMAGIPRMESRFSIPPLFSFETPVEVVVFGHDLDDLKTAGDQAVVVLNGVGGLRDVRTSLAEGYPEVQIRYDRDQLVRLGLDPNTVASQVRDKIQGAKATSIQRTEERVDVRVQLTERQRGTVDDLRRLNINPEQVPLIPLDAVATITEGVGPSEIRRVDQQRAVVVSAAVAGFDLGSVGSQIGDELSALRLPEGTEALVAGQSREMEQSLGSLQFALFLAIFLVYVIMASTFEDIVQPFVILLSVPLAVVGVALTLWALGLAVSVVVLIGAIVLAGVVVNNAIVFVDTINRMRREGRPRSLAIAEAGRLRLRPILITTFTTVLGLLPLSLGFGEGAEIQQPLAITVIGGLVSSTLLTLVVVPVVYRLLTRSGTSRGVAMPVPAAGEEPA
ncbi:MAG: efflux RND transporter permease subunit [Myxococcota bacterium]